MENMFNIDKSHCNSLEQKLLWNIMELLKPTEVPLNLPKEEYVPLPFEAFEVPTVKQGKTCKHCGETHAHREAILCGQKHSKLNKERGK